MRRGEDKREKERQRKDISNDCICIHGHEKEISSRMKLFYATLEVE